MCESYNFYREFCNKIHVKNTDLCMTKRIEFYSYLVEIYIN